eukprot:scaffold18891_cov135-Isochrysis_galbana.AAC.1
MASETHAYAPAPTWSSKVGTWERMRPAFFVARPVDQAPGVSLVVLKAISYEVNHVESSALGRNGACARVRVRFDSE